MLLRYRKMRVDPRWRAFAGSIALCAFFGPAAAVAQPSPSGAPASPPEVMEPPSESPAPPPDPSTGGDKPKEPLSKELKEGEGVLEPPRGIDPKIQKPIPDDFKGKMPVIPPPSDTGDPPPPLPRK